MESPFIDDELLSCFQPKVIVDLRNISQNINDWNVTVTLPVSVS